MIAATDARTGEGRRRHIPDILDVIAALFFRRHPDPAGAGSGPARPAPGRRVVEPGLPAGRPGHEVRVDPARVARRLMVGLADWELDSMARAEHILRNMLFGSAITQVHGEMTRRSVDLGSRDATGDHAVVRFDSQEGNLPFVPANTTTDQRKGTPQPCGSAAPRPAWNAGAARTTRTPSSTGRIPRRRCRT